VPDTVGRLYAGTSGFSYPAWAPAFYPPGLSGRQLLPAYAERLPAVELNNTFCRRPSDVAIAAWLAATPDSFRFCPKAQRGAVWRAWSGADTEESVTWLTEPLVGFGGRLGCVLMTIPAMTARDDGALRRVLATWPTSMPLALELPHPSWQDDEVHALLRDHDVALVAVDADREPEPDLRRIGPVVYLRLRRSAYADADLGRWARRLEPFLADGSDAFVFLRHDEIGASALRAERLVELSRAFTGSTREPR
jgi:uncharacterized protein YecE (DUF72 family)